MNIYARWAVAAIAIVVAVGGAAYFLAPAGGGVGGPPIASPTPSPSGSVSATPPPATAVASASPAVLASDGFVYPGAYEPAFDPALTLTIDREVEHNCAPGFRCRGSIDANLPGWTYLEFGQPRIEVGIVRIDKVNDPSKPGQLMDPPADLSAWIGSRPGVTVIDRKAVTVGGLPATQVDLRTGNKDIGLGPIPGVTDPGFGLGANTVVRLFVLPVHDRQVVISLHAEDGSIDELQPLVDSIIWK